MRLPGSSRSHDASLVSGGSRTERASAAASSSGATGRIRYERAAIGWFGYDDYLRALASRPGVRRVCEIGGGANPALPLEFVHEHGLEYTVLDISAEELAKAPEGYVKVHADIINLSDELPGGYDLIFSRMVAEHVPDGEVFHRNIHRLLAPGGIAFHYFPTLYTLPFVINLLMPHRLSDAILHRVQGGREKHGQHGKFPAFYSWCYGPTARQLARLRGVGFEIEEYIGYYGHSYYRHFPPLHRLHEWLCQKLVDHPIPQLTTTCYLVVRKS